MKRVKIRKVCLVLLLAAATGRGLASPEAEGVPSEALMEFVGTLNALDHPRDFCLMRHGRLVKEGRWRGVIRNAGQQDELANAAAGRTQIGGLTRLLTQMAAGIAVDRERLADDAKLEGLLRRMTADDADGLAAADELSELVEKSVGESTAAFLVANFVNRLGNPLVHNWTAQAQMRDKRLMRGGDGVDMEVRSLARIGDCLLHGGCVGKSRLLSEKWMKSHPARTVAYGGNALVLSPEKDAVLAVLTTAKDARAILAAAERLFATFSDRPLPENPAAEKRLAQTCGSLALPADKAEKSARKPSPPSFGRRHEVLLLPPRGNYKRNSEGDIVQLKDGRLMLMWSRMMGSNADDAKSHICRRHSSDGGKTWTDDEEVFETPKGSGNVMCVSLLRLQSGKIALAYLEKVSNGDCRPWFYTSSDEGKTWTDKAKVVADAYRGYYVFNNARLIQLKSGRLVYSGSSHGGKFGSAITVWLSDDEGRTWRPAKNAISARKPNGGALRMEEPGSVELKDGRVMTYFRTDADWQYASYSSDGGETWGPAAPSSLRSPRSPATIERLADGRLAAVWNDHERYPQYRFLYPYHNGGRMPLTIGFSSDEGRTWTDRVDLEVEDWNCYVFVREIAGRLYIGYCCGDGMRTMRVIAASTDELRGSREKTVSPRPNAATLKRITDDDTIIGIVHFTVNTFTDREWGYGSEDPEVFNPTAFDAEQIVGACAAGGIRGLVIVAKHHDGFCLWPTKTTGHNISKSPFRGRKGDYVKEMSEACRKFGVKFGVYCSPWDRNNAEYGRPKYVETYHEQIRELTGGAYGPIFELWLDGANGGDGYYGGAWEKRSIKDGYYRFEDVVKFVRGHNPDLTIFGFGGEFCWPGNESGVVDPDSGCTRGRGFRPWEADFPLRPGWFYHQSQDGFSRSGEFLMKVYLRTVGNAATMDIGISPDRRGLLTDEDVGSLRRFGELRKTFFSKEVPSCTAPFNLIAMEEDVMNGERVDEWRVLLDGKELVRGGKIGFKRFRPLPKPVCGKELKLEVLRGPARPEEIGLKLYSVDPELMAKVMASEAPKRPPAPFELRGVLSVRKRDELTFMVKHPRKIHALTLTPDKAALGGTPVVFRFSYSIDGEKWADDPAEYRLDNVAANPIPQTVALKETAHVKYVRIRAVRTLAENQALSLAGVELVP